MQVNLRLVLPLSGGADSSSLLTVMGSMGTSVSLRRAAAAGAAAACSDERRLMGPRCIICMTAAAAAGRAPALPTRVVHTLCIYTEDSDGITRFLAAQLAF